ncbi:TatD family hydrolase [Chloroflexota bacterium]
MIIDSHAHIDFPAFDDDRDQVLARAHQQGVGAIITVGIDLQSSRASLQLAQHYPHVFTAVGFHPNQASLLQEGDLRQIAELASDSKVVAIGEIGLDFYRKSTPRQHQLGVFQQQLDLAAELGLPVIIHCRQAHKEVLNILSRWLESISPSVGNSQRLGVIHCFSGDVTLAERYIEMGFLISLPGSVTYPAARDKVEVARQLPLDELLVETDSPFLAPQLHRGQRNEPSYIPIIVDKIARIKEIPAETVAQATAQNTISLFHLPGG